MTEPILYKRKVFRYKYYYICPICKKECAGNGPEHARINLYFHLDKHKRKEEEDGKAREA